MKAILVIFISFFSGINALHGSDNACAYAGSNINFIISQTEKALAAEDVQITRYHAYKALNAIEQSREQLNECGCKYAIDNIDLGKDNLKMATRASSIGSARILLNRALDNMLDSMDALEQYEEMPASEYDSDVLAINTKDAKKQNIWLKQPEGKELESKIDLFLEDYRKSLDIVIRSLNCKEALAYAQKVYEDCEQQLLKGNLSEAKKYYNLKTKEITNEALLRLDHCSGK